MNGRRLGDCRARRIETLNEQLRALRFKGDKETFVRGRIGRMRHSLERRETHHLDCRRQRDAECGRQADPDARERSGANGHSDGIEGSGAG